MMDGRTLVAGIYLQPCSVEADFGKGGGWSQSGRLELE